MIIITAFHHTHTFHGVRTYSGVIDSRNIESIMTSTNKQNNNYGNNDDYRLQIPCLPFYIILYHHLAGVV